MSHGCSQFWQLGDFGWQDPCCFDLTNFWNVLVARPDPNLEIAMIVVGRPTKGVEASV